MGRKAGRIEIATHLSDHNDEQDEIDERLHDEIVARVKLILEDPKYADISPWVIREGP
jgi:hypothetical protein